MLEKLAKIANELDQLGFTEEADALDFDIKLSIASLLSDNGFFMHEELMWLREFPKRFSSITSGLKSPISSSNSHDSKNTSKIISDVNLVLADLLETVEEVVNDLAVESGEEEKLLKDMLKKLKYSIKHAQAGGDLLSKGLDKDNDRDLNLKKQIYFDKLRKIPLEDMFSEINNHIDHLFAKYMNEKKDTEVFEKSDLEELPREDTEESETEVFKSDEVMPSWELSDEEVENTETFEETSPDMTSRFPKSMLKDLNIISQKNIPIPK